MGDIRYRPLYSCWRCGEDRTLPAEELRVCPTGDLSCLDCWEDDRSEEEGAFRDLPAFVPESDAEIARLREEVERLKKERDEARESGNAIAESAACAEEIERLREEVGRLRGALRDADVIFGHVAYNLRQAAMHPIEGPKIPLWLLDRMAAMVGRCDKQGHAIRAAVGDAGVPLQPAEEEP